jgi:prevent-host-death family protein
MAVKEFGIRDLRNHTQTVIDAVESGDRVYLTRRGERIAELRSVRESPVQSLLQRAAAIPTKDTGWSDELVTAKDADRAAQVDRWR